MSFVHLHVHSCYSLLDGAIKLNDLVKTAKQMEMPAVALTDHGQMFGSRLFYKAAQAEGIKPIIGVEAYIASGGRKARDPGESRYHLTLLAQNLEGYRNLCRLVSKANIEGFYHRPRMDKELLAQYSEGIIAMSGCLQGEVPHLFLRGREDEATQAARDYAAIFKDNFYLELQENKIPEQNEANKALLNLAERLSLPVVATNDCHYLLKEHHDVHDVLLCIQTAKTVDEENRMRMPTREFYVKSPQEMKAAFHYCPEAIANTLAISEKCNLVFEKPQYAFPAIKLDEGESPDERMARFSREGLEARFSDAEKADKPFPPDQKEAYRQRLEEEIALINKMEFPSYFLIVADFIGWAKKRGIPVGPGRGSAAGSLVAWALLITDVDPIRFGLLFERFLNPERISMPDIDVDFCTDGRDEVIRYVTGAYGGKEQVAQIITFGQMKAKAAIRDVGRALGIAYSEVDKIAKLVPNTLNISLKDALALEPKINEAAAADPRIKQLLDYAQLLENLPRHASTHAAGVVIGDKPLVEHLPLYCDAATEEIDGEKCQVITQFDMKGVEELGLIKFDFLGLKTLTLINQCLIILKERGINLNLAHVDFDDAKTYELLSRADATGVFQLESSGMRKILTKLKPNCIDDLMALVALYRPGPLGSGMVDKFINCKHGREKPDYPLPQLEPILKETHGVILYQEQVMRISQVLANYSLGEADLLRRAMGKKKADEMAQQKSRFMEGVVANKVDAKKAEAVFDLMAKFAEYGFNKSHSAAYAIVAFQTAYLKAHYPVEFMAALFSSEKDNQDKVVRLINESRAAKIEVLPPDVNDSGARFNVVGGAIRFGLGAVKGLGEAAIDSIIEARSEGPFQNLFDFCERIDSQKVNRRVIEALIKCGAFDKSGGATDRSILMAAIDEALEAGARAQRDRRDGQSNMFEMLAASESEGLSIKWPAVPHWRENQRLAYEKEALGFFITGHPLAEYDLEMRVMTSTSCDGAKRKADKSVVRIGGVVAQVQAKTSKTGKRFAYVTLEDLSGSAELLLWSDVYEKSLDFLKPEAVILVVGTVEAGEKGGQANIKVIAKEIMPLSSALEEKVQSIIFKVAKEKINTHLGFFESLKGRYQGTARTYLVIRENGGEAIYKFQETLCPTRQLIEESQQSLGPGSLELR